MVTGRRFFSRPTVGPGGPSERTRAHPPQATPPPRQPPTTPESATGRILFINQYYWPDHASTAQHLADLAESLAERGHECHVLTSRNHYKPGEPKLPASETYQGVQIHRVPATALGRGGFWIRMTDYLTFYACALVKSLTLPRCDLVVTLTTPPIIGLIGVILARWKGSRHVFWSMDLHPDASLALGKMSRGRPIVRFLEWLAAFVYRQADRVVVLGPYMADRIARKGVPEDRLVTIPVWSRRDEIEPIVRLNNPLRKQLGLGDRFVAMYSGNLGLAHSFDEFLGAARMLRDDSRIVFLFVGGGPRMAEVRATAERESLGNMRFMDYVPRDSLKRSLGLADVHLISMRPEMTGIVVPGKLYGVMAAGRPALFVGPDHCETADAIRDAGCGFVVPTGDCQGVAGAIERLASEPSLASRMGECGRLAFLAHYERKLCCQEWAELASEMVATPANRARARSRPRRREMVSRGAIGLLMMLGLATAIHGDEPNQGVAQIQARHDQALVRELSEYVIKNPRALDRDQAYAALFNKAIEHDWFRENEELAEQYLKAEPNGPVRALAQIIQTMARAQAGQFEVALARYQELMEGIGESDQEDFAVSFSESLAQSAVAAGSYGTARKVYSTLLAKFAESAGLRQKAEAEIKRLDMVGKLAPAFSAQDTAGRLVELESLRGKYVLLDFWATWCAPCVAELPRLQAAYQAHHAAGLEIIGVSLDETKTAVDDFIKARKIPWAQIHNASSPQNLAEVFAVGSIPATYLIDPQGTVIRLDIRGKGLDSALEGLLKTASKPSAPAVRSR